MRIPVRGVLHTLLADGVQDDVVAHRRIDVALGQMALLDLLGHQRLIAGDGRGTATGVDVIGAAVANVGHVGHITMDQHDDKRRAHLTRVRDRIEHHGVGRTDRLTHDGFGGGGVQRVRWSGLRLQRAEDLLADRGGGACAYQAAAGRIAAHAIGEDDDGRAQAP